MSDYSEYFLMTLDTVGAYVLEKTSILNPDTKISCKEIGDGNINYIFRVWDENGNSVIVKQAGHTLRISSEMSLSLDRNRIESEILIMEGELAPGMVPKVFLYDTVMSACIMEDLSTHVIMRDALMAHEIFPRFADAISTFLANTLMRTTDIVLDHLEKKELQRKYINPELCEISELLVYTEPYNNCNQRNNVFEPNRDFVRKELYEDQLLHLEVAKLKFEFMNNAQSLIHGDLHTGSIFVTQEDMRVIDPEFAFFGPMGYDIGNVVANLVFAWCNADATMPNGPERKNYMGWLESAIRDTVDLTKEKMTAICLNEATEGMAKTPGFVHWYMETVLEDTAAVTGLELIRRIVGMANVKDIRSIANEQKRLRAERICITMGKRCVIDKDRFVKGDDFVNALVSVADNME